MEEKYNIIGEPTTDAMFRSFQTRTTRGIKFLIKKEDGEAVVETDDCFIGSVSYRNGDGTTFGLEGHCGNGKFTAEYYANKGTGTMIFLAA